MCCASPRINRVAMLQWIVVVLQCVAALLRGIAALVVLCCSVLQHSVLQYVVCVFLKIPWCCGAVYCSIVAVYYSARCVELQCVEAYWFTACCSVLQRVVVCCIVLQCVTASGCVLQCVAASYSEWLCVAVCCSVLQHVAVLLQCVAVCCSVLQYNVLRYVVRVCYGVLLCMESIL